ncbi:MAG: hypothetical protein Q9209_004837 [Squamulea sp. 1 TL-2023]
MDFDFMDHDHPQPPIRMVMQETQYLFHSRVKRSTIVWTINQIAVYMMRTQYLRTLPFDVMWNSDHIYHGFVELDTDYPRSELPPNDSLLTIKAPASAWSLSTFPTDSAMVALEPQSNITVTPVYCMVFAFVPNGAELSAYQFLRTYLRFLLQLAKHDIATHQPQIAMDQTGFEAWIFMQEAAGVPPDRILQQHKAVMITEAMARYQQQHQDWREMTFRYLADGQLVARGCVTRAVRFRQWCSRLFPGEHPVNI